MSATALPSTQLLNALPPTPPQKVGPQVWAQVRGFVQHHLERVSLSLDPQQKINGLQPQLLINWYHEYCDTRGGTCQTAYSRQQRQNIRRAFEFVWTAWNVLLNEPLLEVRNYPRAPRRGLVNMRALREFRPSDLEKLSRLFTWRLAEEGIVTARPRNPLPKLNDEDRHLIKFYNLAFALIAFVGVTMPGCFANFCRLQRKHIPQRLQDQLIIPRSPSGDLWISVALDDWTRLSLAGLLCHLSRRPKHRGIRRRQLRSLTPEMFLIGACPTPQHIRQLREGFNHWLKDLCLETGVPTLTLERLAQVAQIRLPDLYSAEVIASLTGHITYHPLPPDQAALDNRLLSAYRVEIDLPRWRDAKGLATLSPSLPKESMRHKTTKSITDISDTNADTPLDEELVNSLIAVCRPFVQKTITASQLAQRLEVWARECLSITNREQALPVLLKEQFEQMVSGSISNPTAQNLIQRFNLACIVAWLIHRLQSGATGEKRIRNVNAFLSYRRDALFLLRENPTMSLTELGDTEMESAIALDLSAQPTVGQPDRPHRRAPRPSAMTTWHSLRLFLKKCVGLPLEADSLSRQKLNRTTHYTRLVEPAAVKQMLEICIRRGTAEAYCAYLGILLANYAGLRAIEIVRLLLSQIIVRGLPHLVVRRGKRGKSRIIYPDDVPADFIQILREARDTRWKQTGRLDVPLLAFPVKTLDREAPTLLSDHDQAKRLSRWIVELMRDTGLRSLELEGDLPDLHRLRHSYINRSLVIRHDRKQAELMVRFSADHNSRMNNRCRPLSNTKQVALHAGHATKRVTLEKYVHCLNSLQAEQLAAWQAASDDAAYTASAGLRGRAIGELLSLDHAQAHQKMRASKLWVWGHQGQKRNLQISRTNVVQWLVTELQTVCRMPNSMQRL